MKAAMVFLLLLVATAREIIMQMKGTWLMKDVLEVTTMVKRYHDADLRFGVCGAWGWDGEVPRRYLLWVMSPIYLAGSM